MRVLISKILGLFGRRNDEQEFDAEIQQHLSMLVEENRRQGMSPDEALRAARIHFGGVEQVKETRRELRALPFAETLAADLRYAVRVLRKSPGFTVVSVLTLALGIGVNTTMFNAYNAVALKPLPVKDPSVVVRVQREWTSGSIGNYQYFFSYSEYIALRDQNNVFSDLAAVSYPFFASARTGAGEPDKLRCALVSGTYFSGLG